MNDTLRWSAMDEHQRDALIAEKIFGYTVAQPWGPNGLYAITKDSSPEPESSWRDCPRYTTDMNAAWSIMDHLKPGRAGLDAVNTEGHETFLRRARFVDTLAYHMDSWWSWTRERLCEEICKAALRAVGVDIE